MTTSATSEEATREKSNRHGNRNALTHGRCAYFVTGKLPAGASYVARIVKALKAELESAVRERYGEIDIYAAALCQSAARHEARELLALRWMRRAAEKLTTEQLLAVQREVGNATDARDRCLKALGLEKRERLDPFAELYKMPAVKPATDCKSDGQPSEKTTPQT